MATANPISTDEVNQFVQQYHQNRGAQMQAAQTKAKAPKFAGGIGGFIEKNLPTIGGIAGGIATAPLEALDAVSGVGGTALNVAGASGGAALGQKLQNSLTGSNASTSGAALAGGAGQLGGKVVGGVLGKAAGKLASPVDKGVAKIADKKVAVDAANEVSPFAHVANNQDVEGSINAMKNLNMPATPEGMKTAANLTTGKTGEFNNNLRQILGGNGGKPVRVDVGNYLNHVKDAINSEPLLGQAEARTGTGSNLLSSITKNKESNLFGGEGSLTQGAHGNDVLDSIQYHDRQAARFGNSAPGTEGEAVANVHKQAANYLNEQLGKSAGADKAVADFTLHPDEAQSIKDTIQERGGSPQLGQHVVDTINNSKSVQDLRSAQAPFVKASQLADKAQNFAKGKGFVNDTVQAAKEKSGSNGFSGLTNVYEGGAALHGNPVAMGTLAYKAGKSEPVVNTADKLVSAVRGVNNVPQTIIDRLSGKSTPTNEGLTVGKGIIKTGAQATAQADNKQSTEHDSAVPEVPQADYEIQAAKDEANQASGGDGTQTDATTNSAATGAFSPQDLEEKIAEDPKNASTYISLYNATKDSGSTKSNLTTSQQNELTSSQNALNQLQSYSDQLNEAGGGKGVAGGPVESLLGKLGLGGKQYAQAKALQSNKADTAAALASAITGSTRPAASIIKLVNESMPSVNDAPEVAKQKVSLLQERIRNAMKSQSTPLSEIVSGVGQ